MGNDAVTFVHNNARKKGTSKGYQMDYTMINHNLEANARVLTEAQIWRVDHYPTCSTILQVPFLKATPIPTMIAVGVASPNAQGHAITRTDTKCIRALAKSRSIKIQEMKLKTAMVRTVGMKYYVTLSTCF